MRNTKHLHFRSGHSPFFFDSVSPSIILASPITGEVTKKSKLIACDQYFAQESNLRNGHISTSPELASDPSSVTHFAELGQSHVLPSDMPLDDQFGTVVSKDCQSFADIQRLSQLRPSKSLFEASDTNILESPKSE